MQQTPFAQPGQIGTVGVIRPRNIPLAQAHQRFEQAYRVLSVKQVGIATSEVNPS
jgi:hypothetical protein